MYRKLFELKKRGKKRISTSENKEVCQTIQDFSAAAAMLLLCPQVRILPDQSVVSGGGFHLTV